MSQRLKETSPALRILVVYCVITFVFVFDQIKEESEDAFIDKAILLGILITTCWVGVLLERESKKKTSARTAKKEDGKKQAVEESVVLENVPYVNLVVEEEQEEALRPIDEKFKKLYELHKDDRPFDAYRLLDTLTITEEEEKTHARLFASIRASQHEIGELTQALLSKEEWTHRATHKKCDIFTSKKDPRDFKVTTTCESTEMFHLISLIYETDLYYKWVPGCKISSRDIRSKFFQYIYLRLAVPFPLWDRYILIKGYGDVYDENSVMIYVKSIKQEEIIANLAHPPTMKMPEEKVCVVDVLYSGILLTKKENSIELTLLTRLDLHLSFLPDVIFDGVARYGLAEMVKYIRDTAKKFKDEKFRNDSPWGKRILTTPIYGEIKKRLDEKLAS